MKAVVGYLVLAALLVGAGATIWKSGQLEQRLNDANMQLATLQYAAPGEEYNEIERSLGVVERLPWAANLKSDVREQRATSTYWLDKYPSLEFTRDATGVVTEQDPRVLLVSANASYRAARLTGDKITAKDLDAVLSNYAETLKRSPGSVEVAYNYEFVARMRDRLVSRSKAKSRSEQADYDLPEIPFGQTIHGVPGAPPEGADMGKFKVVIPKRSDERREESDAGKGTKKVRRG